jgi:hypothetical protein
MQRWVTRRRALLIFSLTAVWLAIWYWCFVPVHWRGSVAAYVHGILGYESIKVIGMPPRWEGEYRRLVWERYRVWFDEFGDYLTGTDEPYARGYIAVSVPWLRKRYGKDYREVFAPLRDAAEASLHREPKTK